MSRHRQPEIRYESSGTSFFALLGAIGAGAALMYLLDPDSGRRRRALLRDKYVHGKTVLQHSTERAVHSAASQTRGAIARIQNRISAGDTTVEGSIAAIESTPSAPESRLPDSSSS